MCNLNRSRKSDGNGIPNGHYGRMSGVENNLYDRNRNAGACVNRTKAMLPTQEYEFHQKLTYTFDGMALYK